MADDKKKKKKWMKPDSGPEKKDKDEKAGMSKAGTKEMISKRYKKD